MNVNFTPNFTPRMKQTPNFKAVSIVQVPKKAFANPENHRACSKSFGKALDKAVGDKLSGFWGNILALFTTKPHKTGICMKDSASYEAKEAMDKYGVYYSLSWLAQNTGLPIKKVDTNEHYSFYVFTREHKLPFLELCKSQLKNVFAYLTEGKAKYPSDKNMTAVYTIAKSGTELERNLEQMVSNTSVKELKVENLDEIKNIVKDLDV